MINFEQRLKKAKSRIVPVTYTYDDEVVEFDVRKPSSEDISNYLEEKGKILTNVDNKNIVFATRPNYFKEFVEFCVPMMLKKGTNEPYFDKLEISKATGVIDIESYVRDYISVEELELAVEAIMAVCGIKQDEDEKTDPVTVKN